MTKLDYDVTVGYVTSDGRTAGKESIDTFDVKIAFCWKTYRQSLDDPATEFYIHRKSGEIVAMVEAYDYDDVRLEEPMIHARFRDDGDCFAGRNFVDREHARKFVMDFYKYSSNDAVIVGNKQNEKHSETPYLVSFSTYIQKPIGMDYAERRMNDSLHDFWDMYDSVKAFDKNYEIDGYLKEKITDIMKALHLKEAEPEGDGNEQ